VPLEENVMKIEDVKIYLAVTNRGCFTFIAEPCGHRENIKRSYFPTLKAFTRYVTVGLGEFSDKFLESLSLPWRRVLGKP